MTSGRSQWIELLLAMLIALGAAARELPFGATPYLLVLVWYAVRVRRSMSWDMVGISRPRRPWRLVAVALVAGIVWQGAYVFAIGPALHTLTGREQDIARFAAVRADLKTLAFWLAVTWLYGAIAEELVFRGYLMTRVAGLLGRSARGWSVSLVVVSLLFGAIHTYQGVVGVLGNILGGFFFGALYLLAGRHLVAPIVAHGAVDTTGLVVLYFHGS